MIDLSREDAVFTLTMNAGENRWNLAFVRAFSAALDDVEAQLAEQEGPASLVTCSTDAKFFSNGLDLDWIGDLADSDPDGEREAFGEEFMALMGRIITFPIPTIAAISGHAFGAGMMCSMCHDVRIMRADRGFLCANEMQIGFRIPTPELALFRHKLSGAAFFETVQLAKPAQYLICARHRACGRSRAADRLLRGSAGHGPRHCRPACSARCESGAVR